MPSIKTCGKTVSSLRISLSTKCVQGCGRMYVLSMEWFILRTTRSFAILFPTITLYLSALVKSLFTLIRTRYPQFPHPLLLEQRKEI